MRTFIISASLVLALTQVGLAEGKEDSSSADAIMPGCRAFVKGELSSSYIEGYMQGECVGIIRGLVDAAHLQPPRPLCPRRCHKRANGPASMVSATSDRHRGGSM